MTRGLVLVGVLVIALGAGALAWALTMAGPAPGEADPGVTVRRATDGSAVTVEATGLMPGETYAALLQAGTCAAPGASTGRLGELMADAAGHAGVRASAVRAGATGDEVPLTAELLDDGDHAIALQHDGSVVACTTLPGAPDAEPDATPSDGGTPAATAPMTETPTDGGTPDASAGPVGIPLIDTVVAAVEEGAAATIRRHALFQPTPCAPPGEGAGGPPACESDETPGTEVSVFTVASCEGYFVRASGLDEQLAMFLEGELTLHSIYLVPSEVDFFLGDYVAIFENEESGGDAGPFAQQVFFTAQGVTALNMGCAQTADQLVDVHGLTGPLHVRS